MLEFFHQLYRGLPARSQKAKKAVSRFGSILLRDLAPLTGAAANYATPGTGEIVSNGMNFLSKIIQEEETVEKLYDEISRALSKNEKHYLMIIDDIDRLSEDEVLLIFRLIKSVGRLPKITYLLAYDREVAEEIVSKRYPSEGPSYLEKIVQASFDIPYPLRSDLQRFFIKSLDKVWEEPRESKYWREYQASGFRHFLDLFHDVVGASNPITSRCHPYHKRAQGVLACGCRRSGSSGFYGVGNPSNSTATSSRYLEGQSGAIDRS